MEKEHTHYESLKVTRDAPMEVVRAAYRALSQKYHPDRNDGSETANRMMTVLNVAYETLSDLAKRQQYDAWILSNEGDDEKDGLAALQPRHGRPQSTEQLRRRPYRNKGGRWFFVAMLCTWTIIEMIDKDGGSSAAQFEAHPMIFERSLTSDSLLEIARAEKPAGDFEMWRPQYEIRQAAEIQVDAMKPAEQKTIHPLRANYDLNKVLEDL